MTMTVTNILEEDRLELWSCGRRDTVRSVAQAQSLGMSLSLGPSCPRMGCTPWALDDAALPLLPSRHNHAGLSGWCPAVYSIISGNLCFFSLSQREEGSEQKAGLAHQHLLDATRGVL